MYTPKVGYMKIRRKEGNPYPDGEPVKAVIQKRAGRWYAVISYKVDVPEIADNGVAAGIDRNCRQVAMVSTAGEREIFSHPNMNRLDAKLRRHQRRLARHKKGSGRRNRLSLIHISEPTRPY